MREGLRRPQPMATLVVARDEAFGSEAVEHGVRRGTGDAGGVGDLSGAGTRARFEGCEDLLAVLPAGSSTTRRRPCTRRLASTGPRPARAGAGVRGRRGSSGRVRQ